MNRRSRFFGNARLLGACAVLCLSATGLPAVELDLGKDPFKQGLQIQGENAGSRIDWDRDDPAAFPGDRRGSLRVLYDGGGSTVLASLPLGFTLDGSQGFRLEADLLIETLDASPEDFHVLGFGISNSETTGDNRTGTFPVFGDADVFDHIEVSYFPNVTPWGGPTLTPTAFGGDIGAGDAFWNFASVFGPASDLGDNGPGEIDELPLGVPLRLTLAYDPCDTSLTLDVFDLSEDEPVLLETGLIPLDLGFLLATDPFEVDTLTIHSFQDLADWNPATNSLNAVVRYHRLAVERPSVTVRATPRSWNPKRGGDLILHVDGTSETPTLSMNGWPLSVEPVGSSGAIWKVEGTEVNQAISGVGAEEELDLRAEFGCVAVEDTIVLLK